jgi:hypothetical protein
MKSRLLGHLVSSLDALLAKVLHENQPDKSTLPSETNCNWNFEHGMDLYSIRFVEENGPGWFIGFELMQTRRGDIEGKRVGRIRRWDSGGALTFETFCGGVPIQVIEALIAEATRLI